MSNFQWLASSQKPLSELLCSDSHSLLRLNKLGQWLKLSLCLHSQTYLGCVCVANKSIVCSKSPPDSVGSWCISALWPLRLNMMEVWVKSPHIWSTFVQWISFCVDRVDHGNNFPCSLHSIHILYLVWCQSCSKTLCHILCTHDALLHKIPDVKWGCIPHTLHIKSFPLLWSLLVIDEMSFVF